MYMGIVWTVGLHTIRFRDGMFSRLQGVVYATRNYANNKDDQRVWELQKEIRKKKEIDLFFFRAGEAILMHGIVPSETDSLPRKFWIVISCFSTFFTLYALIHFSIYFDGFLTTCRQYRIVLQKMLSITGSALPVIHSRLQCQAIYDFMDYLQPDPIDSYRNGFINTGLDLILGIFASCVSFVAFGVSSFINIRFTRRSNKAE